MKDNDELIMAPEVVNYFDMKDIYDINAGDDRLNSIPSKSDPSIPSEAEEGVSAFG